MLLALYCPYSVHYWNDNEHFSVLIVGSTAIILVGTIIGSKENKPLKL